jgi:acetyl-CoA carboxylase carboxyl transferase subunit beta
MRNFFQRQGKFRPLSRGDERGQEREKQIPEDLWVKCPKCHELIYNRELERNGRVCPKCSYHFRLSARERIDLLADEDSFTEWDSGIRPQDPLNFVDGQGPYNEKLEKTRKKTGENESLITGRGTINGRPFAIVVAEFAFLGASMGSVWGEKMARAVERAGVEEIPVLTVNSSGGARMHEGLFSLMQMAKTIAAFHRLGERRLPHISLLVDPCYGGVPASYATVADVMLAEPGALIGFAGQRVIEQVTRQKLPEGFQTAEFILEHGMIDQIIDRNALRETLTRISDHYVRRPDGDAMYHARGLVADLPVSQDLPPEAVVAATPEPQPVATETGEDS